MNFGELKSKAERYFRANLEEGKRLRSAKGPFTSEEKARLKDAISWREMDNEDYWQLLGRDLARSELNKFCDGAGVDQPTTKEDAMLILGEIRKAQLAQFNALLEHGQSLEEYDFSEPQSAPTTAPEPQEVLQRTTTLLEAVETFLTVHAQSEGWTQGTIKKRRAILEVVLEWFGSDTPMDAIGKSEAAEFKNRVLLNLPANKSKHRETRSLSLRDAIAVEGVPKIDNATINAYLSACKNLWKWAEAHGYASEVQFDGLNVSKRSVRSKAREPFSQDALEIAYRALTEPDSKFYRKTSHRWATLIAMFSGARLNEVCQLDIDDIKRVDDVWIFDFTDSGHELKRLKTSAAQRRVPIHSELLRLGLLKLVETRQAHSHNRLFPDFKYTEKAGYGDQLSKWFNRTFTADLGIKSEAHVFHGLRHTFATRLAQSDVETERIQFIIGHERQGVTHQVYMREGYTLKQTRNAVEKFAVGT
ncbi:site-specific integrase [Shimia sp. R9_3]|uniref:site-specific integrase n=1 Tax=Shimia sp. R9_3 TaxID=2821113 RepID=UPI001ADCAD7B|nr:site-specific integrase [Shimia sp. R9_3]MBO9399747.1 site-specific integrase [Shimia sp. R9_3]